ncbi:alpha/beta hydrolase fold domain-containing protein [Weissella confusa]|uniref:alpha/beta hydrolase fold domain-containing protein n=1 Tax=Weissella confusa TaxID=1583 RepID=UPI0018F1B208|nr:alpha/beta hydrolase [Weissella confusa]MBJ7683203.1 alpha/beta hydrolase [Weissella confusa]MBJ7685392.1 alpha/beta hydrolase [Weissella confusa]MBJ7703984.1 alpha/beta hydrolase [Weissella confusa]
MYRQLFVFGSRILGLNHVWQLSGKELWEELASKPATAAEPSTKLRHEFEVVSEEYMEILVPKNFNLHKPTTIMLYLHGGGFIEPITAYHWHFIGDLVRNTDIPCAVLDYPLVPHATLDEIYERVHQAIWRLRHTSDGCEVVLVGDSAGAQIALGYVQPMEVFPIERIVAISPMVDMTLANPDIVDAAKHDPVLSLNAMPDLIEAIRGTHDIGDPIVSPINGKFDNQKILLISGTRDLTNPDNRIFAKKFADNVTYIEGTGLPHAYPIWPLTRNLAAKNQIYDFIMG